MFNNKVIEHGRSNIISTQVPFRDFIASMCDCLAAAFPYSMECMDVWKWERQHSNRMEQVYNYIGGMNAMH